MKRIYAISILLLFLSFYLACALIFTVCTLYLLPQAKPTLMNRQFYEDDLFSCEIIDGVADAVFKVKEEITLEHTKKMVSSRLIFFNGKEYPVLIDLQSIKYSSKEAREYLNSEAGLKGIKAGALLTRSTVAKVFFNLFLKFGNIPFPARVFTDREEARNWLKQYAE